MKKHSSIPHIADYKRGIIWTLIDSMGSQGLVVLYHLYFRATAGAAIHGVMGCLLSSLYLLTALTNVGLDKSIAPFLEEISSSQKAFKQFMLTLVLPQALGLTAFALMWYGYYPFIQKSLPLLPEYLSEETIALVTLTFLLESFRKTLRTFLQLSFYFELTTLVELLGIVINLGALYLLSTLQEITLLASWAILAITSIAQLVLLTGGIRHFYRSLSAEDQQTPALFARFSKTRIFSWALQCLNQLYSGNFLVPICALQFGIESASLMKIITSISYWITLIAKKVFGISSNALLAHVKSRSKATQTNAFHYLSGIFNQGVTFTLIFLLINGKKLANLLYEAPPEVTWSLLYFMLIVTFIESFFVLYERWYILEEDAHSYLAINLLSVSMVYWLARTVSSPIAILVAIISIRLLTFLILTLFSFYRWGIKPSYRLHGKTIVAATALSLVCFLIL